MGDRISFLTGRKIEVARGANRAGDAWRKLRATHTFTTEHSESTEDARRDEPPMTQVSQMKKRLTLRFQIFSVLSVLAVCSAVGKSYTTAYCVATLT
jgi:hypothetical protein